MICWINPVTGLAGDMLLAALIDAGAPVDVITEAVAGTGLDGWELTAERIVDHGLSATRVLVTVTDERTERPAVELIEMAGRARPEPVAALAVAALRAIATTEARLHGVDPGAVHLHELGGHDTIVDIVGVSAALHSLGVTEVFCAPLPMGTGTVHTAHGVLPCPAPATIALLSGATVTGTDLTGETVTPTAAALLAAMRTSYDRLPAITVSRTGYGAGTRRLPGRPNAAAVTLGSRVDGSRVEKPEELTLLATNLDDVTGETLAHVIARALADGALDAWTVPSVMKKGRPGHVLHVLARPDAADRLARLMLVETGSLGVRHATVARTALPRRFETVHVDGCPIRIKIGPHGAKAEHDDVALAASRLGLPLRQVAARALARLSSTELEDPR